MEEPHHTTYEIGPETTVGWDDKAGAIELTVGEKGSVHRRVFRVIDDDTQEMNWEVTKQWCSTLREIATRKRLWYVLEMRARGLEEYKCNIPSIENPPPRVKQRKVSNALENHLEEMFYQDHQDFLVSALRFSGNDIYYDFKNRDLHLLWYVYAAGRSYLGHCDLEHLLFDAFERAFSSPKGKHVRKISNNVVMTITDRVYSAKIYLDSNMDG